MSSLCVDCNDEPPTTEIRKRSLCNGCYRKFVSSKILKRMDTYRFKNQNQNQVSSGQSRRPRLLVGVSGGVSSLVLLNVLDRQVRKQVGQQGRSAFEVVCGHVLVEKGSFEEERVWWKGLGARFVGSGHTFLEAVGMGEGLRFDERLEGDLEVLGFRREGDEDDQGFMHRVLSTPASATAREDLKTIILRRILTALAKVNDCESIIFGHSDTRLAALALAEVAKGRGGGVPDMLADGPSTSGVNFNYPVRDIYLSELEMFRQTLDEEERDEVFDDKRDTEPVVSIRGTSIDALLSRYITSQGEKYPSIMANVVRTASKLQSGKDGDGRMCRLCAMPVGGAQAELCYGCERMKQDIKT